MHISEEDKQRYLAYIERKQLEHKDNLQLTSSKKTSKTNDDMSNSESNINPDILNWCIQDILNKTNDTIYKNKVDEDDLAGIFLLNSVKSLVEYLQQENEHDLANKLTGITDLSEFTSVLGLILLSNPVLAKVYLSATITAYQALCEMFEIEASDFPRLAMENDNALAEYILS